MNIFVPVGVVFVLALLGLGSAIKCYSCQDYRGRCAETRHCGGDDACLTLKKKGGKTSNDCIKVSDCDASKLDSRFPDVDAYMCCTGDLCNSATVGSVGSTVLGLLFSLLLWFVL